MEDKDSEATRASPDATTLHMVTGPTLPAPGLPMIGITEGAPVPPAPKAQSLIQTTPAPESADVATRLGRLEYRCDLLANGIIQYPAPPAPEAARQPQQERQHEAKQGKEIPAPDLNTAGAGLLFATSTTGTTLVISKEVMILLVVLVAGVIVVSVLCIPGRIGGTGGAPTSA